MRTAVFLCFFVPGGDVMTTDFIMQCNETDWCPRVVVCQLCVTNVRSKHRANPVSAATVSL